MKAIAVFILFIGMFLMIQGYYAELIKDKSKEKIVIKYVPRSVYEEQLSPESSVLKQFNGMFNDITVPASYTSDQSSANKYIQQSLPQITPQINTQTSPQNP